MSDQYPYQQDVRAFEAIVASAQRTIVAQIEAALSSGDLRAAGGRRAQLAAVGATLEQLAAASSPFTSRLVHDAWYQAAARAEQQIAQLTITTAETPGAFNGVSREAVHAMQESLSHRLDSARQTLGRRVEDVYAREQRRAALRALLGADGSPHAASKELQRRLTETSVKDGRTGFVDSAGRRWSLDTYSNMAVRTVTREAAVQGAVARMASHGINIARVSTHAGSCEICLPYQGTLVSLDGSVTEWKGQAVSDTGALPPFHPNAVMAGTSVLPIGTATGAVRAEWNGPLRYLATRGGIELPIGPNHPVLTARGWVKAQFVENGDRVVRRVGREGMGAALRPSASGVRLLGTDDDLNNGPALVEQVFDALFASGVHSRVVPSSRYLHGDGNFCEGEIDVIRADRQLAPIREAALCEPCRELVLACAGTEAQAFTADRALVLGLGGVGVPTPRRVDLGHVSGSRTDSDAALLHPLLEGAKADAGLLRQLRQGLSCGVALDEVVEARDVESWSGHAFDLETPSATYFANDMLVHNCAHSLEPVAATIQSLREEIDEGVYQEAGV